MNEQENNMTVENNVVSENNVTNTPAVEDKGSFGWIILGFFFPLVGFILFLVWMNSKKKSAKQSLIGALIGFFLPIVFYLICWPMIQRSVVTKTCQLYNEKYEGIKIDDTQWGCQNKSTGEVFLFSELSLDENEETTDIEEDEESDDIIIDDNSPYKDLDFSLKTSYIHFGDEQRKAYIEDNSIKYTDPNVSNGQVQTIDIGGVISVGIICDCGSCHQITYLTSDNELYELTLDHGEVIRDSEGILEQKYNKKISNNVVGFAITKVNDPYDTCGSYNVIYKTKDGKIIPEHE